MDLKPKPRHISRSKLTVRSAVDQAIVEKAEDFMHELIANLGCAIDLTLQTNSSLWMRIERSLFKIKLSLHASLVEGTAEVKRALCRYIKRGAKEKEASSLLSQYLDIHAGKKQKALKPIKAESKGDVYDLQEIFDEVNRAYFEGELNLSITWFSPRIKKRRFATLGLYEDKRKLIKINKSLDSEKCPRYFVEFVVYHEALHCVHPVTFDAEKGKRVIHGPKFKADEKKFSEYALAKKWQKEFFKIQTRMR
jgi:hypothetical protein